MNGCIHYLLSLSGLPLSFSFFFSCFNFFLDLFHSSFLLPLTLLLPPSFSFISESAQTRLFIFLCFNFFLDLFHSSCLFISFSFCIRSLYLCIRSLSLRIHIF